MAHFLLVVALAAILHRSPSRCLCRMVVAALAFFLLLVLIRASVWIASTVIKALHVPACIAALIAVQRIGILMVVDSEKMV